MLSQDDNTYTSTGPLEQPSRPISRRELLNERRQAILQQKHPERHTDFIPRLHGEVKTPGHIVAQLREENKRLRQQIEEQQAQLEQLIADYNSAQEQFEKEIEATHYGHQQELEQYQAHLREMMEERKELQESYQELQRRYQELYHEYQDSFHEAVEEEAGKMVKEAARTLVLSPEYVPPLLHDVKKTVEFQVKQEEDQHIAEALYMMRQAQIKAEQLEQELARERAQIDAERHNLVLQQRSIREQANVRYEALRKSLQARSTIVLTMMTTVLLLVLPILQFFCLSLFRVPLTSSLLLSLLIPIIFCVGGAYYFAHVRFVTHTHHQQMARYKKASSSTTAKNTAEKKAS
jgi:hypothetical protein